MTDIQQQVEVGQQPAAVIAALTTAEGLQGWWCRDSDIGSRVGDRHVMRFDHMGTHITMVFDIAELGADTVSWQCGPNGNPDWPGTTITWNVATQAGGSIVTLRHSGFAEGAASIPMVEQGWAHFLASLKSYLETGTGTPS